MSCQRTPQALRPTPRHSRGIPGFGGDCENPPPRTGEATYRCHMTTNLRWVLAAAVILSAMGALHKKPRTFVTASARRLIHRAQLHLYLQHREATKRAIDRIAAELAQRRCDDEGNLDEEYWLDWYRWFTRWFTGDPTADVGYRRKQERDLDRLRRWESAKRG